MRSRNKPMEATSQNASDSSDISGLNRSRCLPSLQLRLPSLPVSPSIFCGFSPPLISSNSRLPLLKHTSPPPALHPHPIFSLFLVHSFHRHFVSPFPRLFKHSSGGFSTSMSSYLSFPLCIPGGGVCVCVWWGLGGGGVVKEEIHSQSSSCWCPRNCRNSQQPGTHFDVFFVAPLPGPAVCFCLIKFGM